MILKRISRIAGHWLSSFELIPLTFLLIIISLFQLFQANRDQNSIAKNAINPPILARYVKLNPRSWYRHISMRIEYYGCVAGKLLLPPPFTFDQNPIVPCFLSPLVMLIVESLFNPFNSMRDEKVTSSFLRL